MREKRATYFGNFGEMKIMRGTEEISDIYRHLKQDMTSSHLENQQKWLHFPRTTKILLRSVGFRSLTPVKE